MTQRRLMDETLPLLVVAAAAVIAVRWLFSKLPAGDDDTAGYVSEERILEQVRQLQTMFPNIPISIIRDEYIHSRHQLQLCIDRLLQMSDRFQAPVVDSATINASHNKDKTDYSETMVDPSTVDRATWERDAQVRHALLRSRKAAMLKAARDRLQGNPEQQSKEE